MSDILTMESVQETPKRVPYATWSVGGNEYKLVLQSGEITTLESKLGKNLLAVLDNGDIMPPLTTMLTIVQGAMSRYHHGMNAQKVQSLYDTYIEEGGTMTDFVTDVVLKVFEASGFFTQEMAEKIQDEM